LAGALAGCGREEKANATSVSAPPAVRVTRPKSRHIVRVVGQPSFVESYERTSIYPKVTGFIEKWYVDIGDDVKKGQVLADLFVPEIKEDYQTKGATVELNKQQIKLAEKTVLVAKADVQSAQSRLDAAKAILERYQALVDRWESEVARLSRETNGGVVDRQVLDESKNQLRANVAARAAAQADIAKAEADLESADAAEQKAEVAVAVAKAILDVSTSDWKRMQAWVGYLKLYAPFDGRIVARNANTGDFVMPLVGDPSADSRAPHLSPDSKAAPIYVVDRTDVVRIFVDIPESDANYVRVGSKATVMIRAFRDRQIPATVTRTSWALNVKSRTLRAEIDLRNTDAPEEYRDGGDHQSADVKATSVKSPEGIQILPGMYAFGKVIIERSDVMALPSTALVRRGEKTFCWTVANGRSMRTEVQTGITDGEWVEVTSRQVPPPPGSDDDPWEPIDGSEQVILGDLSILNDGSPITLTIGEPGVASNARPLAADSPKR
jgi:multidrug efflux pump subunit AcrA (membrane-fusion protein)